MGRLENPDRPAYHLRKQYFLRKTYTRLPSQCVSFQCGSESWLLAAPIIEMIEMFRGQAFFPLLALYSTAKCVGEKARADYKLMMMPISLLPFHSHQARF